MIFIIYFKSSINIIWIEIHFWLFIIYYLLLLLLLLFKELFILKSERVMGRAEGESYKQTLC